MKDKNWTDIVSKQGDLRHFASMAIRKSGKSEHTSAQEIDFLFRIALSEEPLTPRQITSAMGISKTIVSRLTDHLESKGFICKEASASDRRSYCIRITGAGKDEIDRMYYYYLDPIYTLQKNMEKENFASSTISRSVASMRAFFQHMFALRRIDENPADNLKSPKVEKKLPEMQKIINKYK